MKRILALISALLGNSILQLACTDQVQPADEQQEVIATLTTFIRAFEKGGRLSKFFTVQSFRGDKK